AAAHAAVENELERQLARAAMQEQLARSSALADRAPAKVLHHGSGWGALERIRRQRANQPAFGSSALPFPDNSIGEEQKPWLALLERGELPRRAPSDEPGSLMVQ